MHAPQKSILFDRPIIWYALTWNETSAEAFVHYKIGSPEQSGNNMLKSEEYEWFKWNLHNIIVIHVIVDYAWFIAT